MRIKKLWPYQCWQFCRKQFIFQTGSCLWLIPRKTIQHTFIILLSFINARFYIISSYCVITIIVLLFWELFTPAWADSFSQESEWLQVSRTLLSILADLSNTAVWMVSTRTLISPSVTIPDAPITISITITFMFHSFFCSLARSTYLSFFSLSFSFTMWSAGNAKSTILFFFSFFFFFDYQ